MAGMLKLLILVVVAVMVPGAASAQSAFELWVLDQGPIRC